jgi:hypothetical protein
MRVKAAPQPKPWVRKTMIKALKYLGGWPNNDISDYLGVKPRMNAN